jgi:phosphoribosylformylglycinamidine (FGAM) synthase-like enzyme
VQKDQNRLLKEHQQLTWDLNKERIAAQTVANACDKQSLRIKRHQEAVANMKAKLLSKHTTLRQAQNEHSQAEEQLKASQAKLDEALASVHKTRKSRSNNPAAAAKRRADKLIEDYIAPRGWTSEDGRYS